MNIKTKRVYIFAPSANPYTYNFYFQHYNILFVKRVQNCNKLSYTTSVSSFYSYLLIITRVFSTQWRGIRFFQDGPMRGGGGQRNILLRQALADAVSHTVTSQLWRGGGWGEWATVAPTVWIQPWTLLQCIQYKVPL